jgi:NodT family efflux transporter outer membrane factor (OMF) lipoprotein
MYKSDSHPLRLALPRLSVLAAALLLAGCASMGAQRAPARVIDTGALPAKETLAALAAGTAAWPQQDWWRAYGDPQLSILVQRARAGSPTLALAQARVRQAAALEGLAEASLAPQASLGMRSTRQHFSANSNVPKPLAGNWAWFNDASVGLSYEVDFWDKNGSAVRAAAGRVQAQMAEEQAASLALSVAVVQAYLKLDQLFVQRDLAERALGQREHLRALVAQRVAARIDSSAELKQAEIAVPLARAQLASLDEAIALTRGQLAALAGEGPDAGAAIVRPGVKRERMPGVPQDLSAALLGRRPELVALRWRVEAASGDIDVAKAQFYPATCWKAAAAAWPPGRWSRCRCSTVAAFAATWHYAVRISMSRSPNTTRPWSRPCATSSPSSRPCIGWMNAGAKKMRRWKPPSRRITLPTCVTARVSATFCRCSSPTAR